MAPASDEKRLISGKCRWRRHRCVRAHYQPSDSQSGSGYASADLHGVAEMVSYVVLYIQYKQLDGIVMWEWDGSARGVPGVIWILKQF